MRVLAHGALCSADCSAYGRNHVAHRVFVILERPIVGIAPLAHVRVANRADVLRIGKRSPTYMALSAPAARATGAGPPAAFAADQSDEDNEDEDQEEQASYTPAVVAVAGLLLVRAQDESLPVDPRRFLRTMQSMHLGQMPIQMLKKI